MNARSFSPALCAVIAAGIAACSGDTSMPTDPSQGGALHRGPAGEPSGFYDPYSSSGSGYYDPYSNSGDPSNPGASGPYTSPGGSNPAGPGSPTGGPTGGPTGAPTTRPITEFLRMQGTYCAPDGFGGCQLYAAPTGNFISWFDQATGMAVAIDYATIMSGWMSQNGGRSFGTDAQGQVLEEPLSDGTSRIMIDLHVANALGFAVHGPDLRGNLTFGARVNELMDPRFEPGVGHLNMRIELINPTGAPLPDLVQLIREPRAGQRLVRIVVDYNGNGFNYANGVEQGTPTNINLHYDESMGPIHPHNPMASGNTPPTGWASVQMTPY